MNEPADRKSDEEPDNVAADQIERAFQLVLDRSPDDEELSRSIDFLATPTASISSVESLTQFCHALLNLNEFAYIP